MGAESSADEAWPRLLDVYPKLNKSERLAVVMFAEELDAIAGQKEVADVAR